MADQMSRIKYKQPVLQSKPSGLCFVLMMSLCVLAVNICSVQTATCSSSVPPLTTTTTEQCSFTGYTLTKTYGVAEGQVSKSLYYLYWLSTPSSSAVVRKVDASGSQTWMASFAFQPIIKCLSVDATEQSVYLSRFANPLVVLKLAASDGSIISQHQL